MSCEKCQEKILIFDQLSEAEQDTLLEHIGECDKCSEAFEQFLQVEEALDVILQDEVAILPQKMVKKPNPYKYLKRAALICASLFIICLAAWNTPPVKAAIERALNELIGNKFLEMDKPLEHKGEDKEKKKNIERIIYTVHETPKGNKFISYQSGSKSRREYENGNLEIIDGSVLITYYKEENVYTSEKLSGTVSQMTQDIFQDLDPDQIKNLGETTIVGRKANMYEIDFGDGTMVEYWFDKETNWIINEYRLENGERLPNDDGPKLLEFNVIEVEKGHKLFDTSPPEGAELVEFDPMRILKLDD